MTEKCELKDTRDSEAGQASVEYAVVMAFFMLSVMSVLWITGVDDATGEFSFENIIFIRALRDIYIDSSSILAMPIP